ncbi:MAG: phosphate ABC transporter, permease protein PstA, partial [Saccharopolyspora sp.]|nr:phosphate ABC transporter, permease protein PstA [Saccharopolyspora sp.]
MRTDTADVERPATAPAFQHLGFGRKLKNNLATVVFTGAFVIAVIPLLWVLFTLVQKGAAPLLRPDWWSHSFNGLTANDTNGGIYHALVGTVLEGLVCAIIAVPLGVLVGIYLIEYGQDSRFAKITT